MTPNTCSNFEKEEQSMKDHNTWYQTVLQGHYNQNSLVLAWEQSYRTIETTEVNWNLYGQLVFGKGGRNIKWSNKIDSSTNSVGRSGQPHA